MGLEQLNFDGLNKEQVAIDILQKYEPPEGYYLAFSGGKDSVAIYDLAQRAGVKFDAHYCVSPIDPPQIYKFIREYYPDVIWDYHARGFWKTVVRKGLPMRQARWCCSVIKEAGGIGRRVVTGIRRAESANRSSYKILQTHRKYNKELLSPMLNFDDYDVWDYISNNKLPYCSLYDEGFKRLGCVLCPYSRDTEREMEYFPKIAINWLSACNRIIANRLVSEKTYKHKFQTGQELFNWWIARK